MRNWDTQSQWQNQVPQIPGWHPNQWPSFLLISQSTIFHQQMGGEKGSRILPLHKAGNWKNHLCEKPAFWPHCNHKTRLRNPDQHPICISGGEQRKGFSPARGSCETPWSRAPEQNRTEFNVVMAVREQENRSGWDPQQAGSSHGYSQHCKIYFSGRYIWLFPPTPI